MARRGSSPIASVSAHFRCVMLGIEASPSWRLRRQLAWCPSPDCEHAVEARADVGGDPLDVTCKCGAAFCFQCKHEAHRPVRAPSLASPVRQPHRVFQQP